MALTDVLNSLSLQPATTLTAQTGLPVSIGIVPDIAQLQLTNIELVDVDLAVLEELAAGCWAWMHQRYPE